MKTEREARSIQKCLDKLVEFLNTLAGETHYNYSYPIESVVYDNNTETILVTFENGDTRNVNVHMDSVSASMKDAIKILFNGFY